MPQLVAQSSAEATLGDVDKEALTNAMVRACVLDLLNPAVFEVSAPSHSESNFVLRVRA